MLGYWRQKAIKSLFIAVLIAVLGVAGCSQPPSLPRAASPAKAIKGTVNRLAEVPPPSVIRDLRTAMEPYQPQVSILSPKSGETIDDTTVQVKLQVNDLPLFQDPDLGLGPHLEMMVDNQPYGAVYDLAEPIELTNLEPGTHTVRVFAMRPWHESFKNDGAFAQTTFHLFAQTPENNPDPQQPLLTFDRPEASYGAEPVLLDFYLSNTPLHLVAAEDSEDDLLDWQVRCTINGESFVVDRWEPLYLKGLKPGRNWIQLELLDETGKPFANAFNNTVRLINYEPNGENTLAKLTRGELTLAEAMYLVDPNYEPPAPEPPTIEPNPLLPPELQPDRLPESPEDEPASLETPDSSAPLDLEDELPTIESPLETIAPPLLPNPAALDEAKVKELLPEEVEDLLESEPIVPEPTETIESPLPGSTLPESPDRLGSPIPEKLDAPVPPGKPPLLKRWRDRGQTLLNRGPKADEPSKAAEPKPSEPIAPERLAPEPPTADPFPELPTLPEVLEDADLPEPLPEPTPTPSEPGIYYAPTTL